MAVLIKKELLDIAEVNKVIITEESYQHVINHLIKASNKKDIKLTPQEKKYASFIQDTINKSIDSAKTTVLESTALEQLVNGEYTSNEEKLALLNTVNQDISTAIIDALHGNVETLNNYVADFYDAGKTLAFQDMQVETFSSAVDDTALNFISNYDFGLVQNVNDEVRGYIQSEMYQGIEQGKTIPELAQAIERTGIEPITNPVNGYTWTVENRANMIAVTEANRASNQAALVSYAQYGVELVDVVGDYDDRTCDDCADDMDNSPYPIDEVPPIPEHPFCRHDYAAHTDPADFPSDVDWNSLVDLTQG